MKAARITAAVVTLLIVWIGVLSGPGKAEQGNPDEGKKTYAALCTSCHGTTGKGDGPAALALPVKPQNHTDGKHMNALTNEYLFNIIKSGGAGVGKSPLMPAWSGQLEEQQIHDVVAYIRSLAVPPYESPK